MLNLTLNVYTQSSNAVWICQLCDTVYIHLWSCSLLRKVLSQFVMTQCLKLYCHVCSPLLSVSSERLGKKKKAHVSTCMSVCHSFLYVSLYSWMFSRLRDSFPDELSLLMRLGQQYSEEIMLLGILGQEGAEPFQLMVGTETGNDTQRVWDHRSTLKAWGGRSFTSSQHTLYSKPQPH